MDITAYSHHQMNRINAVINNPGTSSEQKLSSIAGIVAAFERRTGPFEQMDEFGCTPYDSMMANVTEPAQA